MALTVVTIGDGAMATVCARILAAKAEVGEVRVWGRDRVRMDEIRAPPGKFPLSARRQNPPDSLRSAGDDATLFENAATPGVQKVGLIVSAVPTQFMRGALQRLKAHVPAGVPVVSVAKGIEIGTLRRPSEIIAEVLGDRRPRRYRGPQRPQHRR